MSHGQLVPPVGPDDHIAGAADAPVTLVEYGDFECPYCGAAFPIVKSIAARMGPRLRLVFRNFPLSEAHPHAEHAAEAAESAAVQGKFWEMHDELFTNQDALEDDDLLRYAEEIGTDADRIARELEEGIQAPKVRAHFRSGVRSGVNGTPTFFINGERFDGDWTDDTVFLEALSSAAGAGSRA